MTIVTEKRLREIEAIWEKVHGGSLSDWGNSHHTLHRAFPDLAAALREAWAERHRLRVAGQVLADTLVQHHQWHAAQTNPDPEHGFIPADEYADSSLYERTVTALGAWRQPVNEAALNPKSDGE